MTLGPFKPYGVAAGKEKIIYRVHVSNFGDMERVFPSQLREHLMGDT